MSFIKQPEPDVVAAVVALVEAQHRVEETGKKVTEAGVENTNAIANCNKIQQDFDILVSYLRSHAPPGTMWDYNNDN